MKKVIIIRYSEIWLKGKNKGFFERAFETNLNRAVRDFTCELVKQSGRYLIQNFYEDEADAIIEKLKKVFGAHTISLAYETATDMDSLLEAALLVCNPCGTFKVESHRGDKKYPLTSVEISKELGARLLSHFKGALSVDVRNPSFTVRVDIRETAFWIVRQCKPSLRVCDNAAIYQGCVCVGGCFVATCFQVAIFIGKRDKLEGQSVVDCAARIKL